MRRPRIRDDKSEVIYAGSVAEVARAAQMQKHSPSIARDIPLVKVYSAVMPFVAVDVARLVILCAFPELSLWLPHLIS